MTEKLKDFPPVTVAVRTERNEMTMRDQFAMAALQGDWATGRAANSGLPARNIDEMLESDARFYYRMADAMLAARKEATS